MGVKMLKLKISLKARALRYLSMREHSRLELGRKLSRYAEESDDVPALLDLLESAKFLSAERFSESLVRRRQAKFGNQRILSELQSHNLDKTEIEKMKAQLTESEAVRAIEVLHKKYNSSPADHLERAKQMQFLQQRGFSGKSIQTAMRASRDGDEIDPCCSKLF
jgi:regulatory protein